MSRDMLPLRPYQREAIDAVFTAHKDGMRRPAVVLPTGAGKGHPASTDVPTPDGFRKWGDLAPGDQVIGSDGRPINVLDVYRRGVLPVYRVSFSDGSSVVVDGDHLWSVRDNRYRRTSREVRTLSTADLFRQGLRDGSAHRFHIPMASPVSYPSVSLPIDPYTLGSLIANGCMTGAGTQLTTPDTEVVARIRRKHTANKINDTTPGVCDRYSLPGLSREIRSLGLGVPSADKHIPTSYLNAPVADRVALLKGLMDGDGSSRSGGRRSVLYHTTSERLAVDVVELVASLGGTASANWMDRVRDGRPDSRECTVNILTPVEVHPFHSSRKRQREAPRRSFKPRRSVVSIVPEGKEEVTCIRVDAADSLYLVTRSYIVTHNTVVFAHLASEFEARTGHRVLVLVHRDELADQAVAKLRAVAPHLHTGKVKASDDDVYADVVVASVQTLSRPARLARLTGSQSARPIGLVVHDECHLSVSPSYRKVDAAFPDAVFAGFTATLERGDGIGLGSVWDDVVATKSLKWMISKGHLVPPVGRSVAVQGLDTAGVKRSGGDYQDGAVGRALEDSGAADQAAAAYREYASDRPGIVFWPTVATAEAGAESFNRAGLPSAVVSGSTPREERRRIYAARQAGEVQALHNCMVLTTGFDDPGLSAAMIARFTQSRPLYQQMVGRVLRPFPGKSDALVLDLVGASDDHKLTTLIDLEEGLFAERKPCTACHRVPCACPCAGCGGPRPCPDCREPAPELVLKGSGNAVELFESSRSAWLLTYRGVMFVPAGPDVVLLWPTGTGTWDVALAYRTRRRWTRLHADLPLEAAMSWAEVEAEDLGGSLALRGAAWRRRKAPASQPQLDLAARYRLPVPQGATKAQAADLLSVYLASRLVDRFVAA